MVGKEELQPLGMHEYARLVELGDGNDYGVPEGRYLLTQDPIEVDVRAKLALGPESRTEVVWKDEGEGIFLVAVRS